MNKYVAVCSVCDAPYEVAGNADVDNTFVCANCLKLRKVIVCPSCGDKFASSSKDQFCVCSSCLSRAIDPQQSLDGNVYCLCPVCGERDKIQNMRIQQLCATASTDRDEIIYNRNLVCKDCHEADRGIDKFHGKSNVYVAFTLYNVNALTEPPRHEKDIPGNCLVRGLNVRMEDMHGDNLGAYSIGSDYFSGIISNEKKWDMVSIEKILNKFRYKKVKIFIVKKPDAPDSVYMRGLCELFSSKICSIRFSDMCNYLGLAGGYYPIGNTSVSIAFYNSIVTHDKLIALLQYFYIFNMHKINPYRPSIDILHEVNKHYSPESFRILRTLIGEKK